MRFGNASTTLTGTVTPASVNTRCMPDLRPTRPMVIVNPHTAGSLWLPHSLRSVGGLGKGPQLPVDNWRPRPRAPTSKMDGGLYTNPPGVQSFGRDFKRGRLGPVERRRAAPGSGGAQRLIQLDLDVDPGRQFQLHEGVHGLVRGVQYVHQTLV